ncbi:MAG: hypothetical protein JWR51_1225 [Devosia sp.]|uniref:hypothetical protein n=1 Tax=Devosia sp. TaxID=1871048 RepID=UPI002615D537|nr:hypothetical protein [Devosia sp.]MDB5528122.1 hypothetical protein [Devosia sp.]
MPKDTKPKIGAPIKASKAQKPPASVESVFLPKSSDLTEDGGPVSVLKSANADFSDLGGNYRAKLHEALARVYAVALFFDRNPDAWQDFCRDPTWATFKGKPPTVIDTTDKLQPTVRFAVGFELPTASKTASKYYAALAYPYQTGVPASDIAAYLETGGGIEELAAKAARKRRNGTLDLNAPPMVSILAPLDEPMRELLRAAPSKGVKFKLSVIKTDGIGEMEIKIHRVSSDKKTSAKPL